LNELSYKERRRRRRRRLLIVVYVGLAYPSTRLTLLPRFNLS